MVAAFALVVPITAVKIEKNKTLETISAILERSIQ
jgi:hypothetical protein